MRTITVTLFMLVFPAIFAAAGIPIPDIPLAAKVLGILIGWAVFLDIYHLRK